MQTEIESVWLVVAITTIVTFACKNSGLWFRDVNTLPTAITRTLPLLAPALLAAIVVSGTFATMRSQLPLAEVAGILVAALAIWRRAPLLLTMLLASACTAAVRYLLT